MALSFDIHREQMCRIRRVMNFIGNNLDAAIGLDDLADEAELSRAHFVRSWRQQMGEPPILTLRRLRLERAHERIRRGAFGRLTDVGFDAGYGSSAAFSHAFRKHFGIAPADVPVIAVPFRRASLPMRLEYLPERTVWQFSYAGAYGQNGYFKARAMWLLHRAQRPRLLSWRVNDLDHPFLEQDGQRVLIDHFVPRADASMDIHEMDRVTHAAGLFAVVEVSPAERISLLPAIETAIRDDLGCQRIEGRTLDRDIHERAYRIPQARRIEMYLPVSPVNARGLVLRAEAESRARRKS